MTNEEGFGFDNAEDDPALDKPRLKSLTGEAIDPRTIQGDPPYQRCQNILDNRMQCLRPADLNDRSYCKICNVLEKEELDGNSSATT